MSKPESVREVLAKKKPKSKAQIMRDQKAAQIQQRSVVPIAEQSVTLDTPSAVTAPQGRPTDYNEELAAEFCQRIATGHSMRTVCRADDMPDRSTIFLWMGKLTPEGTHVYQSFIDQYTRACEERADAMAEDILDIADDGTNDYMEIKDADGQPTGKYRENGDALARSRLRVDTRRWLMGQMKPKKYGRNEQASPNVLVAPVVYIPRELPYDVVNNQRKVIDGEQPPQTTGSQAATPPAD